MFILLCTFFLINFNSFKTLSMALLILTTIRNRGDAYICAFL